MPYKTKAELPDTVQENLPAHAQEIFKDAFNNAWDEYEDPSKRRGKEGREETAFKVAWAAVKREYHKTESGEWKKK